MHFSVLVITRPEDNLDEVMDPFYEGISVEPYIYRTKEQIIEDTKKWRKNLEVRLSEEPELKEKLSDYDKELLNASTDEDFYKAGLNEDMLGEDGNEYTTYNPDSKYDWYEVGGRFSGYMCDKNGNPCDECKIKDLSTKVSKEEYGKAIRFWELLVEEAELLPGETSPLTFWRKEYYVQKYKDKYSFAKCQSSFLTHGILYNDVWKDTDDFETTIEFLDYFNDVVENAPEDSYVYLVDRHI